jgi:hypothetical protein
MWLELERRRFRTDTSSCHNSMVILSLWTRDPPGVLETPLYIADGQSQYRHTEMVMSPVLKRMDGE